MSHLRKHLIKSAYENKDLRPHLLPILREAPVSDSSGDLGTPKQASSDLATVISDFLWVVADQLSEYALGHSRHGERGGVVNIGRATFFGKGYPAIPLTFYYQYVDEYGDYEPDYSRIMGEFLLYSDGANFILITKKDGRPFASLPTHTDKHKAASGLGKALAPIL
jgi:hypothetical protein